MNTITQNVKNSYMMQRLSAQKSNQLRAKQDNAANIPGMNRNDTAVSSKTAQEVSEIRRMLTGTERTQADGTKPSSRTTRNRTVMDEILGSMQNYGDSIRTQRQQTQNTSLAKKKFNYHFKNISAQIIRSKTSMAAKQVATQATREILKLKREKMSGKYDSEEVEAAILHAESMERVARKKVRHLEEEELAKASGASYMEAASAKDDDTTKSSAERFYTYERTEESTDTVSIRMQDSFEGYTESTTIDTESAGKTPFENNAAPAATLQDQERLADLGTMLSGMDRMFSDADGLMDELTDELMDAFTQGMRDMMDEMGFSDMADSLLSEGSELDPDELKMLKIKHRIREMKELTEADSAYLKAFFDHLENMKNAANFDGLQGDRQNGSGSFGTQHAGNMSMSVNASSSITAEFSGSANFESASGSLDIAL